MSKVYVRVKHYITFNLNHIKHCTEKMRVNKNIVTTSNIVICVSVICANTMLYSTATLILPFLMQTFFVNKR